MPIPQASDTINLSHPTAGDANAGNGGDGVNHGDIYYQPAAYLENTQKVYGADTDLHNGSHFWQHADWEAGGGGPGGFAQGLSGALAGVSNTGAGGAGGSATSNGNQGLAGGTDAASVGAQTTATQTNTQVADQSGTIIAGMGGYGGNNNVAVGGAVSAALLHTNPHTETETTTTTVTNTLDHFVHGIGDIDLSHIG